MLSPDSRVSRPEDPLSTNPSPAVASIFTVTSRSLFFLRKFVKIWNLHTFLFLSSLARSSPCLALDFVIFSFFRVVCTKKTYSRLALPQETIPGNKSVMPNSFISHQRMLGFILTVGIAICLQPLPALAQKSFIPVGSGGFLSVYPTYPPYIPPAGPPYNLVPVTATPLPAGVQITGAPNGAILTSKWWTSLLYKVDGNLHPNPMNIITPTPLNIESVSDGVGCRQPYFIWPVPLPPLYQGPALKPDYSGAQIGSFNEVVVTVGITGEFGVDNINYGLSGSNPDTAAVEYGSWHVTYDTFCQKTEPGTNSKPRLRTTIARGSPYMWVEYLDGFPAPGQYPTKSPTNYPMVQVQYTNTQAPSPILYLPNKNFTTTSTTTTWNAADGGIGTTGTMSNAIAFTVNGRNYAAFGPPGTSWTWLYDPNQHGVTKLLLVGKPFTDKTNAIVVAALPQNLNLGTMAQAGTLQKLIRTFGQYALVRPGNTGIPSVANFRAGTYKLGTLFQPAYDPKSNANNVTGTFSYNLVNVGTGTPAATQKTLFALFPHQQADANLQKVTGTDAPPFGNVYGAKLQYTSTRGYATNQEESRTFANPAFYDGRYNGQMILAEGTGFVLQYSLPLVAPPVLPNAKFTGNTNTLLSCLGWDFQNAWANGTKSGNDSYGWAKLVSAVANNYQLAQQMNLPPSQKGGVNDLGPYLQKSLVGWLDARSGRTTQPTATGFAYDPNWNVMLPYPPGYQATPPAVDDGFFVVRLLNDMHFHYGYFIRAAAVYGQYNKPFVTKYGAMVEHLIRNLAAGYDDIPNSVIDPAKYPQDNAIYPPYRFFDAYIGSSSAAGAQQYDNGENQESWSEAINAWYGMLLWAQLTGKTDMAARAAYMYVSEADCSRRYVFNEGAVTKNSFYLGSDMFCNIYDTSNSLGNFFQAPNTPPTYSQPNFSREGNHAIEWLPFGGGALYLALNRNGYQKLNYDALVNQHPALFEGGGGSNFVIYNDLIYMYQAIFDGKGAQNIVSTTIGSDPLANNFVPVPGWLDNGDSLAFLYQWVYTLPNLEQSTGLILQGGQ